MTRLYLEIIVTNVSDAHKLMRILQRKSFTVKNDIKTFSIRPEVK